MNKKNHFYILQRSERERRDEFEKFLVESRPAGKRVKLQEENKRSVTVLLVIQ